jgi:hypothetical protein
MLSITVAVITNYSNALQPQKARFPPDGKKRRRLIERYTWIKIYV